MATKLEFEVEVKSSAEKMWAILTHDCITLTPKALPHVYESFEVLEGDGVSTGSVRLVRLTPGTSTKLTVTERIESMDEENKTMSYTILDGELLNYLKNFKSMVSVSSKEDGSSVVKFVAEFDKASGEIDGGELYKEFANKDLRDIDAYFLQNA